MNKRHITSLISQGFGKFASKEFPRWFQKIVNSSYVGLMGLNMSEFNSPSSYSSLNALFTRNLKKDRKYSLDKKDFISPCDSWISESGKLDKEYALQIKGMKYNSDELLGSLFSKEEKSKIHNGNFMNFYLSPKDYHRYHAPMDLRVIKTVHIPGKFYPVNMPSLNKRINLFVENERVVIMCENELKKKFFIVLVSALNVGVMQVSFAPQIQTNANQLEPKAYKFDDLYLKKGDDFGCFEMGSTIVILSQKNMLDVKIKAGDNVKYGDNVAKEHLASSKKK